MNSIEQTIDIFFEAYALRFNKSLSGQDTDIEGTINSYANSFVEASPLGVSMAKNDQSFKEAIPKAYEFYKSIGTKSMKILSKEITPLDEFHSMVKVHWKANYVKRDGATEEILFDVIYILQHKEQTPKIFAYITGDEQKALMKKGLIDKANYPRQTSVRQHRN